MAYLDNIRTFARVYELGSMSAAARDLRISAAVASSRISQLEEHLGVRLFQRTTRMLNPTEQGQIFYPGALKILEAVDDAEAEISDVTENPRGTLYVAAPLGVGQRLIAPAVPQFRKSYPQINIRLRLSDRRLDITAEGLDAAFFLGQPEDSSLRIRKIADCPRILCASPDYIARRGQPRSSADLVADRHDCLNLRFPGAPEFQWPLETPDGIKRIPVVGPLECDHGEVLTGWALAGLGIVLKPVFEVVEHLRAKRLIPVLPKEPPIPVQMACLYTHRRRQDPKTRLFIDFMVSHIQRAVEDAA
ncbi:DNA-binding transcriptional regulator, LysR family [Paracoccus isoporae]|uniref:DNA-binding transcriptional regulator, LysR family n=1 Tax=Paracoccus isoporae TaxID=591205 RepID=A0A1G6TZ22_9RHOB|nr:LysR family transcriptional regulator [Paracoccus isoporae]SDD33545.1 DNA-binding transcriptional regulator, LysR family [Paracoccus isoporae]